jgi:hypothetical protein
MLSDDGDAWAGVPEGPIDHAKAACATLPERHYGFYDRRDLLIERSTVWRT